MTQSITPKGNVISGEVRTKTSGTLGGTTASPGKTAQADSHELDAALQTTSARLKALAPEPDAFQMRRLAAFFIQPPNTQAPAALDTAELEAAVALLQSLVLAGRYEDVMNISDRLLVIAPDDPRVSYWIGIAMERDGEFEGALRFFQISYLLEESAGASLHAGNCFAALNRDEEARAAHTDCIKLAAGDAALSGLHRRALQAIAQLDAKTRVTT